MKKYAFYISDISVSVYEKKSITPEIKKELKDGGYYKIPFETSADNEADATDLMLKHFKNNTEMLEEFAMDNAISYTIFGAIHALSSS